MASGKWLVVGLAAAFAVSASVAFALGPHEVAVLVNGASAESRRIADAFVDLRRVPRVNVIELELPASFAETVDGITAAEFTEHIWKPANARITERGLDDHILAWVYSTKFPVVIRTKPQVSIQGITFVRNRLPDANRIDKGMYFSPIFAGPNNPNVVGHYPQSFDVCRQWLGVDMPLPSMMLGVTGKNGNNESTVLGGLLRGVDCDGSSPTGTVWFVDTDDVRSRAREWQFRLAVKELALLHVDAVVAGSIPKGTRGILGVLMGARNVRPEEWKYRSGCMAEHLTSFGALFRPHNQTRLTAWLEAGVTASSGAVTEPYAAWTKFPSARFFAHYARGCTMIESFFQSIACPLQILLVGEPLASPWKPKAELIVAYPHEREVVSGTVEMRPSVQSEGGGDGYRKFVLLVDGKTAADGSLLAIDTRTLPDGPHTFRIVGYGTGLVRDQVFKTIRVTVRNAEPGGAEGSGVGGQESGG